MDRLSLDADVLFSAAYRADSGLQRLWKLNDVVLCSSLYALEEARVNLTQDEQRTRLVDLAKRLQFFEAADDPLPRTIVLPDKDIPILLAAIAAHATHLLTGDIRHFGPYLSKKIQGILILLPGDYLRESGQS